MYFKHESYPVNEYDYVTDREDALKLTLGLIWKNWLG